MLGRVKSIILLFSCHIAHDGFATSWLGHETPYVRTSATTAVEHPQTDQETIITLQALY